MGVLVTTFKHTKVFGPSRSVEVLTSFIRLIGWLCKQKEVKSVAVQSLTRTRKCGNSTKGFVFESWALGFKLTMWTPCFQQVVLGQCVDWQVLRDSAYKEFGQSGKSNSKK